MMLFPARRAPGSPGPGLGAVGLALAILSIVFLPGAPAMAIEEPAYQVVRTYPGFELRRYGPMLLAETQVGGDFDAVGNQAFQRLAGFIFGGNVQGEKIEMTAPVSQRPAGDGSGSGGVAPRGDYVLSFAMPARFTAATLPVPTDPSIRVRTEPARLMAARRYSGRWTWGRYREQESALLEAVGAAGLTPLGYPVYARYNAPFVPWFMRRNEVLVEVRGPGG